jgi:hypothetical protein
MNIHQWNLTNIWYQRWRIALADLQALKGHHLFYQRCALERKAQRAQAEYVMNLALEGGKNGSF